MKAVTKAITKDSDRVLEKLKFVRDLRDELYHRKR